MYEIDTQQGPTVQHRVLYSMSYNGLQQNPKKNTHTHTHTNTHLSHFAVYQKVTQYCKSTILQ